MPRIVLTVLVIIVVLSGCATNMKSNEVGKPESPRKVLIAGEHSGFKEQVVAGIIEELGTRDWYFRIIGLDSLTNQDTEQYGAVLVVTAFRAGRLDRRQLGF